MFPLGFHALCGAWARIWNLIFFLNIVFCFFTVLYYWALIVRQVFGYSEHEWSHGVTNILGVATISCAYNNVCDAFGYTVERLFWVW